MPFYVANIFLFLGFPIIRQFFDIHVFLTFMKSNLLIYQSIFTPCEVSLISAAMVNNNKTNQRTL